MLSNIKDGGTFVPSDSCGVCKHLIFLLANIWFLFSPVSVVVVVVVVVDDNVLFLVSFLFLFDYYCYYYYYYYY